MKPETILDEEAKAGIKNYCISRNKNGKCNNCRYSIKKVVEKPSPFSSCIFENCPDSWRC